MILSSRIFLVLLLPLLVHGAPTSNPPNLPLLVHGAPTSNLPDLPDLGPTPLHIHPYVLPKTLESPEKFQFPHEPDLRPVGGISPRPIIAEMNPWDPSKAVDVEDSDWKMDAYVLPPGTNFRKSGMTSWIREEGDRFRIPGKVDYTLVPAQGSKYVRIEEDMVATTPFGAIVLLPKTYRFFTWVRLSRDDIICLPALSPGARVIYSGDLNEIEKWCNGLYASLVMDKESFDLNLERCIWENYWHVGRGKEASKFIHVPVLRRPLRKNRRKKA